MEIPYTFYGRLIKLVDAAGIRRFAIRNHDDQIENLSVLCKIMSEPKMIHIDLTNTQCLITDRRTLVPAANKNDLSGAGVDFETRRIQNELQDRLHKCAVFQWCASPCSQEV